MPIHLSNVYGTVEPLPRDHSTAVDVHRFSRVEDVPNGTIGQIAASTDASFRRQATERFARGFELWIGTVENKVAGWCWSRTGRRRKDYFVPLEPDDATILAAFVLPSFRGRGIYPRILRHIAHSLMTERSVRRVYLDCQTWNAPSIRGIEKAGFKKLGTVIRAVAFGKVLFRWPPIAPIPLN